ncbi:uncharacterized protein LOC8284760 isoform X3 [Ricinus communis]|uniref:uncharacterized protein LOC8284760 isoform X3 n=1 Tax=Ricinus communis TaxID=3988 RepID=UPI00201A95DA|nr:uncharacterized protein LOC8284760 isoform X3 [Ricinus communis]
MANASLNTRDILKPFFQRASEAENLETLSDAQNEGLLKTIGELQTKLECVHAELASEQEKARKLAVENAKLQYRILHLVQAVRHSDSKLENMTSGSEAKAQTIKKLEDLRL